MSPEISLTIVTTVTFFTQERVAKIGGMNISANKRHHFQLPGADLPKLIQILYKLSLDFQFKKSHKFRFKATRDREIIFLTSLRENPLF